jgi:hypothetical protein
MQFEKHDEHRISAFRGIMINLIDQYSKGHRPMRARRSVEAREGKKADDITMTIFPDANPIRIADPSDAQTLMPATTTAASSIRMSN